MADTLELIRAIPAELREQFKKDYVKIHLWQRKMLGWDEVNANLDKAHTAIAVMRRKALGWDKVHESLEKAPWCDYNEQIVNVLFCYKCTRFNCLLNNLCGLCERKRFRHYIYYFDYDDCFKKKYQPLSRKTSFNKYRLRP